ncbi:MAG: hypothetical protein V3U72_03200 [Candidatus Aenigmarchaeota archaeon]
MASGAGEFFALLDKNLSGATKSGHTNTYVLSSTVGKIRKNEQLFNAVLSYCEECSLPSCYHALCEKGKWNEGKCFEVYGKKPEEIPPTAADVFFDIVELNPRVTKGNPVILKKLNEVEKKCPGALKMYRDWEKYLEGKESQLSI